MSGDFNNFHEVVSLLQEQEMERVNKDHERDKKERHLLMRQSLSNEAQGDVHCGISELLKHAGPALEIDPNAPGGLSSLLDNPHASDDEDGDVHEMASGFPSPPKGAVQNEK